MKHVTEARNRCKRRSIQFWRSRLFKHGVGSNNDKSTKPDILALSEIHCFIMRVRRRIAAIVLAEIFLALLTFLMMASQPLEDFIVSHVSLQMTIKPEPDAVVAKPGIKTIVWYDVYHNTHGLRNSAENAKFSTCEGIAKNCQILPHVIVNSNSNRKPAAVEADAVLFQGCHVNKIMPPSRKSPNQIFVLAERENWKSNMYEYIEANTFSNLYSFRNAFNWTMTYRWDSDILLPYGEVKKMKKYVVKKRDFKGVFKKKKYDAVWFVSHCHTQSLREDFVKEMQQYITVHIYGKCGNFSCPRKLVDRDSDNDCLKNAAERYKFVLSFENSYRPNYVTEKLFDWFPRDIVPVVRGGGGDYALYGIPEGTILDADSFPSAKDLALYMKTVGSDEATYTAFLERKQGYYSVPLTQESTEAYCKLCEMLQDVEKHRKVYTNIGAWWDSALNSDTYPDIHNVQNSYWCILVAIIIINLVVSALVCMCMCLVRKV